MTLDRMHEAIADLLPGYALGALDRDERASVESHLQECREHDDELVALRATVLALGTLEDELQPSATLTAAIDRIAGREAAPAPAPVNTPARGGQALPPSLVPSPRSRRWPLAAAAVVAVLAVFATGWFAGGRFGTADRYSYLVQAPDGVVLQFSGRVGADHVTVWMAGLTRLPEERRYQLWAIRDDGWLTIGVCNVNAEGRWRGDFDFALAPGEEIALTIEPAPGSERPTAEPLLRSRF